MNKLLDKYKKIPAPVKAGLWFFICTVLQKGIVFLTVPIFTRLLTTEQYGLFDGISVLDGYYFCVYHAKSICWCF